MHNSSILRLLAFLLLAGAAVLANVRVANESNRADETLRLSQIASCERGNGFRREVNRQSQAFIEHNLATLDYFRFARAGTSDPATKREIDKLIKVYDRVNHQHHPVPLTDCKKEYPKP